MSTVSIDLKQISNVVENEFVKKSVYNELVKKVNAIDTRGLNKNRSW